MLNVMNYRRKSSMLNRYINDVQSGNYINQSNVKKQKNGVPDLRIQDFVPPRKDKNKKVDQELPQPPRRQFRVRLFYNNNKTDTEKGQIVLKEAQKVKHHETTPKTAEELVPEVTPILDGIIEDLIGNLHRSKKFYFSKTLKTTVKKRPRTYREKNTTRENVIQQRWSSGANHPEKGSSAPRKRDDREAKHSSSNSSNNSDLLQVEHVSVEIGASYGSSTINTTTDVHFPRRKGQKKKRRDKKRPCVTLEETSDVKKVSEKMVDLKDKGCQAQPRRDDEQDSKDKYSEENERLVPSQAKQEENVVLLETKQQKASLSEKKRMKQRKAQSASPQLEVASTETFHQEEMEKSQSPMPSNRKINEKSRHPESSVNRKMICEDLPQAIRDVVGQQLLVAMRERIGADQLSSDTRESIGQQLFLALSEPVKQEWSASQAKEELHPRLESINYDVPLAFHGQKGPIHDPAPMPNVTRQPIGHNLPQLLRESVGQELLGAMRKFIAKHQLPPDARESVGQEILQAMREPVEAKVKILRKPIGHMLPQYIRKHIGRDLFNAMMELVSVNVLSEEVRETIGREILKEMCTPVDKAEQLLRPRNIIGENLSREQRGTIATELSEIMKWYVCEEQLPLAVRQSVASEIVEAIRGPEASKAQAEVTRLPIGVKIPQPLRESLGQQLLQAMRERIGKEILPQSSREVIGLQLMHELRQPVSQQFLTQQTKTGLPSQLSRRSAEETEDQCTLEELIGQRMYLQSTTDKGIHERKNVEACYQQIVQIPKQQRFSQRVSVKGSNEDLDEDIPNRYLKDLETQRQLQTTNIKNQLFETSRAEDFAPLARERERVDYSFDQRSTTLRPTVQPENINVDSNEYYHPVKEMVAQGKPQVHKRKVKDQLTSKRVEDHSPQIPERSKRGVNKRIPQRSIRICDAIIPQTSAMPTVDNNIPPRLYGVVHKQVLPVRPTDPCPIQQTTSKIPLSAQTIQRIPPEISTNERTLQPLSTETPVSAPTTVHTFFIQPSPQLHVSGQPVAQSAHIPIYTSSIQPSPQMHASAQPVAQPVQIPIYTSSIQPSPQMHASAQPVAQSANMPIYTSPIQQPPQIHVSSQPVAQSAHIPTDTSPIQQLTQIPLNVPTNLHPTQVPACISGISPPTETHIGPPTTLHQNEIPDDSSYTSSFSQEAPFSSPCTVYPTQALVSAPTLQSSTQRLVNEPPISYPTERRGSSTSSSSNPPRIGTAISSYQLNEAPGRMPVSLIEPPGLSVVLTTSLPPQIPFKKSSSISSIYQVSTRDSNVAEMQRKSETANQYHYIDSPRQSIQDVDDVDNTRIYIGTHKTDPEAQLTRDEPNGATSGTPDFVMRTEGTSSSVRGFQTRTRPIKELSSNPDAREMLPIPRFRDSVRQTESSFSKLIDTNADLLAASKRQAFSNDSTSEESSVVKAKPLSDPSRKHRDSHDLKIPVPKIRESLRNIRASMSQMMQECEKKETGVVNAIEEERSKQESEFRQKNQFDKSTSSDKYSTQQVARRSVSRPTPRKPMEPFDQYPGEADNQLMHMAKCPKVRESFKEMRESIHSMLDDITETSTNRRSREASTKTVSSVIHELREIREETGRHDVTQDPEGQRSDLSAVHKRKSFSIVTPTSLPTSNLYSSSSSTTSDFQSKVSRMRTNSPPSSDDLVTEMGETVSDWNPRSFTVNDEFYAHRPTFSAPVHCIHGKEMDNEEYVEEFKTASDGGAASVSYIRDRTWLPYHRTAELKFVIEDPREHSKDRRMTLNQRASVYGLDLHALKNLQKTKNKLPIRTESALDTVNKHHHTVPTINTIQKMRPIHDVQIEITAGTRDVKSETKAVEERLVTYFLAKVASK